MEFGRRGNAVTGGRFLLEQPKPSRVNALTFYQEPPANAISLDDFESLAVDRLKVLSAVENSTSRGESMEKTLRKLEESMKDTHMEIKTLEEKEQDNISHWVLRLAFAATEDLRRRFLAFEMILFRFRFEKRLDMEQVQRFMEENKLGYTPMDKQEFKTHYDQLRDVYMASRGLRAKKSGGSSVPVPKPIDSVQHYKVPFTEVLDLVTKRNVFLHKGFAYVPETDLISILLSRFRSNISQKLAIAYRSLPYIQEDRIRPILKMLETAYVGPEFGSKQATLSCHEVRADNLDQFAQSFPMCMREVHAAIKRDHHLKYHARLQFQLYLKGIGLSMQDCLKFFQFEFAKRPTPADVFQKQYAYPIRHAYGQEGKRADYAPYSCTKIILGPQPSNSDEHHGCPFKTYNIANMKRLLVKQMGSNQMSAIDEIVDQMQQKQYQLACRKHFELTHIGANSEPVGNHPNAWFEESVKFMTKNQQQSQNSSTTTAADTLEASSSSNTTPMEISNTASSST